MRNYIDEAFRVALPDLFYMKRNILPVLVSVLVMPLLYFISFGYGLGSNVGDVDGVSYVAFVIPGVIAISTLTSCFSTIANKIMVQRRFYSSFDEIMICPLSPSSVVLGKTIIGMCKSLLCTAILLCIGYFACDDLLITPALVLMIVFSSFTFSLLGVTAGLIAKGLASMNLFQSLIILPMTFLSGTVFSLSSMPEIIQYIVKLLPLSHSTDCIRSLALGWEFPWISFLIISVYCVIFFVISRYVLVNGKYSI